MKQLFNWFLLLLCFGVGTPLKAEYFTITNYDIQVKVYAKGFFEVTETIDVLFTEPRRGIIRKIPYRARYNGEVIEIDISEVEVDGWKSKISRSGGALSIRIGDKNTFVEGAQKYVIKYIVEEAFLFHEDFTEFNWNFVGDQWDTTIDRVKFNISFDQKIELGEGDYYVYAGQQGSQDTKADIKYIRGILDGVTSQVLLPGEGVTAAVKLPKDYIHRPTKWEKLWKKYGFLALPIFIFGFFASLFYRYYHKYGKNEDIVKVVQYTPPKGITPSEAGLLIDERADNRDLIALLPYWATNGYIQIRHIEKKWAKDDYELIKVKDIPNSVPLYETTIFNGLFSGRNTVLISDLREQFYTHIQNAKAHLRGHMNAQDIYTPNSIVYQRRIALYAGLLFAAAFAVIFLFKLIAIGISMILSGVLGIIIYQFMLKKNEKGLKLYQEIVGFRMFMKAAEKDKLERMLEEDPNYFEKTLAYAVIFGYAKSWSKKFDGLLVEPPSWYVGPYMHAGMHGGFSPSAFGADFESSMNDIQSAFVSVPASSGGSGGGFSGGGSVGGGFGGGGGSSW